MSAHLIDHEEAATNIRIDADQAKIELLEARSAIAIITDPHNSMRRTLGTHMAQNFLTALLVYRMKILLSGGAPSPQFHSVIHDLIETLRQVSEPGSTILIDMEVNTLGPHGRPNSTISGAAMLMRTNAKMLSDEVLRMAAAMLEIYMPSHLPTHSLH